MAEVDAERALVVARVELRDVAGPCDGYPASKCARSSRLNARDTARNVASTGRHLRRRTRSLARRSVRRRVDPVAVDVEARTRPFPRRRVARPLPVPYPTRPRSRARPSRELHPGGQVPNRRNAERRTSEARAECKTKRRQPRSDLKSAPRCAPTTPNARTPPELLVYFAGSWACNFATLFVGLVASPPRRLLLASSSPSARCSFGWAVLLFVDVAALLVEFAAPRRRRSARSGAPWKLAIETVDQHERVLVTRDIPTASSYTTVVGIAIMISRSTSGGNSSTSIPDDAAIAVNASSSTFRNRFGNLAQLRLDRFSVIGQRKELEREDDVRLVVRVVPGESLERIITLEHVRQTLEVPLRPPTERRDEQIIESREVVVDERRLHTGSGGKAPRADGHVTLVEHELLGHVEEHSLCLRCQGADPSGRGHSIPRVLEHCDDCDM